MQSTFQINGRLQQTRYVDLLGSDDLQSCCFNFADIRWKVCGRNVHGLHQFLCDHVDDKLSAANDVRSGIFLRIVITSSNADNDQWGVTAYCIKETERREIDDTQFVDRSNPCNRSGHNKIGEKFVVFCLRSARWVDFHGCKKFTKLDNAYTIYSMQWRVIYSVSANVLLIQVIQVTPHDYR